MDAKAYVYTYVDVYDTRARTPNGFLRRNNIFDFGTRFPKVFWKCKGQSRWQSLVNLPKSSKPSKV